VKVLLQNSAKGISRRLVGAALLSGFIGFAGAVQADPITAGPTVDLTFSGALFPAGYKATTIQYDNGNGTSTGPNRVAAGTFSGTASNGVGFEVTSLYTDEFNVLAYCVDILNGLLRQTSTYHVNDVTQNMVVDPGGVRRDFGRTLQFLGAANQLAALEIEDKSKSWLNPSSNWMAAAIQVGIWETLYERESLAPNSRSSDLLSTSTGWFTASSIGTSGDAFLNSAFSLMQSNNAPVAVSASQVKWLQIDGGQDLLVDPVDVPAPAPLLLLLSGLALLLRRRG